MDNKSTEIKGTKITLYLHDNLAKGWREASIDQWSGKAICFPVAQKERIIEFEKSERISCVYFLIGSEAEEEKVKIYIGQTDNFKQRMINHIAERSHWIENIVIIRNFPDFSLTALKYLEHKLYALIDKVNYDVSENGQAPQLPNFAIVDKAGYEIFFKNIQILMPILGYDIFRNDDFVNTEKEISSSEIILKYKEANGYFLPDGRFRVSKDSIVELEIAEHFKNHSSNKLRERLIQENIIKLINGKLIFTESYDFKSKSGAACVVAGSAVNGNLAWK